MAIFNFQTLLYSLTIISFCILFPQTNSLTFNLTNLDDQDQKVNVTQFGDAHISTQGLQFTSCANQQQQVGKATYIDRLQIWNSSTGKLLDFSTHFVFVIDSEGRSNFADGFAFFLAPEGSKFTAGGAMGLPIDPVTIAPTSPFVAVEFDTFYNGGWDPDGISPVTHVGINVNSLKSNVTAVWYSDIFHGIENEASIKYDSSSYNLSVVFTDYIRNSRVENTIHFIVDLRDYLPEWVTIGFSASTGALFEKHTVKSWDFSSSLEATETNSEQK